MQLYPVGAGQDVHGTFPWDGKGFKKTAQQYLMLLSTYYKSMLIGSIIAASISNVSLQFQVSRSVTKFNVSVVS